MAAGALMRRPATTPAQERHRAAREESRGALSAFVEAAERGDDLTVARARVAAARAAEARTSRAVERAARAEQAAVCARAAALYEAAQDVRDWQERAARLRAHATEHQSRIAEIDAQDGRRP